jgi:hypothetical protein
MLEECTWDTVMASIKPPVEAKTEKNEHQAAAWDTCAKKTGYIQTKGQMLNQEIGTEEFYLYKIYSQ